MAKKRELISKLLYYLFLSFLVFLIENIKSKQDDLITKDLIEKRHLKQSKLRFTRYYQIADGSYQQDEASTAYSCVMTEGKLFILFYLKKTVSYRLW